MFVGKTVNHITKGKGTIVDSNDKYVFVDFGGEKPSQFAYPSAFSSYLTFLEEDLQKEAEEKNKIIAEEKARKEEKELEKERARIARINAEKNKNSVNNTIIIPSYSSVEEFCADQRDIVQKEISFLRSVGEKRTRLTDGKLIENKSGRYYYSFETDTEVNYPDNTQITLWYDRQNTSAVILNSEDYIITIVTNTFLGNEIQSADFSAESWRLLQTLNERLDELASDYSPIVNDLVLNGKRYSAPGSEIKKGQAVALKMSNNQPILFVWGPPGTGKTKTLADIAIEHINKGERILMLSYSNVSVDGATLRVFKKDGEDTPGRILRFGYPKDKEILDHPYLSSYSLALHNHPELREEREKLISIRKGSNRDSREFVQAGERLTNIRRQLNDEEKESVSKASFVATTVSKAIVDGTIYKSKFDVVIFDEASMAYIPQVIFSASLATKHFVCMGDFSQLPPIVQSSDSSALNADIFHYGGIADSVKNGFGHKWLVLLDIQYRMHPDIASMPSKRMYKDLLRSDKDMKKERAPIVNSEPLNSFPMGLVDLSGMMSTCKKTLDGSRINILSAFMSVAAAAKAARSFDVGIITPYYAQSRLISAIVRDMTLTHPKLNEITCATVHKFQGSEKDIIVYDPVECYRMPYLGGMISQIRNDYANRLFNVALTRAKGKFIAVGNYDYFKIKNLSKNTLFHDVIDYCQTIKHFIKGRDIFKELDSDCISINESEKEPTQFINDIIRAKNEIRIEIPGKLNLANSSLNQIIIRLTDAKRKGINVDVRAEHYDELPEGLRRFAVQDEFVYDPITIIDKKIVWFGAPMSAAEFITEIGQIKTLYRPVIRFEGKKTASTLYGIFKNPRYH